MKNEVIKNYKVTTNGEVNNVRIVSTDDGFQIEAVEDITTADWGVYGTEPVYSWTKTEWYGYTMFKTTKGAEKRIKKMASFSKEWNVQEA